MKINLYGLFLTLAIVQIAGCAAPSKQPKRQLLPNELTDNPQILFDKTVPREQMTLRGIKLGDPESAIAESRITNRGDGGWIVCNDGARYRLDNGAVATLGLWDAAALGKLNIKSPEDIEARFGKPESSDDAGQVVIDHFDDGHISVLWNKFEQKLNAVNVAR